jgi:uncharacterized protein YegL
MFRRRRRVVSGFEPEAPTSHPDQQLKSTGGERVIPVYIVCDESASMEINGGIAAINQALPNLHAEIAADPLVSDMCRIGLITFSDTAEELMSLTNLSDVVAMPVLQSRGVTNYGPVFDLLKSVISRDIANLKSQGFEVFRPLVIFLIAGEPAENSGWESSYRLLMDKATFRQFPNIIAIGMAGADEDFIAALGTLGSFVVDDEEAFRTEAMQWLFSDIQQRLWYGDFLGPEQYLPMGLRPVFSISDSVE